MDVMEAVSRFTRRPFKPEEIFTFAVNLCDNETDRDGECFSDEALDELRKRFVGVTGITDHNPSADNQIARIFDTELIAEPGKTTADGRPYKVLRGKAYMVRTDSNADRIREIDAGIKKEVSISCAVTRKFCSVCGRNILKEPCRHIKGKDYGGAECRHIIDGVTDVFEWSFVAVPAQPRAGVTKTFGAICTDPEKEFLRTQLRELSATLDRYTGDIQREVIRLCYRDGDTACAKALAATVPHLSPDALLSLRDSLLPHRPENPAAPQLTGEKSSAAGSAYRFGGRKGV